MSDAQHHIDLRHGDVARYVLLPGDPDRVEQIAALWDDAELVARKREYVTWTGTVGGVRISATSTGIGCPSTAIAVEELVRVGADTLIRVGTAGAMQEDIALGDVVIATGAIRDEGTTRHYLPIEYPAVADIDVTAALRSAAQNLSLPHHLGIAQTKDSFYGQHQPERMPVSQELLRRWDAWIRAGAKASEMEAAALFVVGQVLRVRTGTICLAAGNQLTNSFYEDRDAYHAGVDTMIGCAIEAVKILAQQDGSDGSPVEVAA